MPDGIRTTEQLKLLVEDYLEFDEFVIDVETLGTTPEERLDPLRNTVFWISLAGPGRCDVIPCGHPLGERVRYSEDDASHRITKTGKYQEHRVNPDTGKIKWFDLPPQFTPAPKQLWISEVAQGLEPLLFGEGVKVGHHVSFDLRSLAKYYNGAIPPPPYADTEVAARLVNENYPAYDLKSLVSRAFHYKYPKLGKMVEVYSYSEAHSYSYMDAKYDWLLWRRLKSQLSAEKMWDLFFLEMDLLPVLIDMEQTGVHIDEAELAALGQEFAMEMARCKVAIDKAAGYDINLNANLQVAELVYDTLGHICKEWTDTEQRKTSKDVLEDFIKDPIVAAMLDYKALNKLQGTFVEGISKRIHNGTIHPSFQQAGTVTGRMSCRQPNIQQVPQRSERSKRMREIFVAAPKKVLIVADLSQIELRVLAHYTQDPKLLQAYREGLDLHAMTAANVFGPDFTPEQRALAKNGNFSIVFGAGPGTLVRRYGFPSEKIARAVLEGFYASYEQVGPWQKHILKLAYSRHRGKTPPYVKTVLGRKRRLPGLLSVVPKKKYGAQRQAVSSIIQGSAADLFKVAVIDCDNALIETGWDAHILMVVHDELVVEVPKRHAFEGLELVKHAMENVKSPWTGEPILTVPLVAEANIVSRWSEAK